MSSNTINAETLLVQMRAMAAQAQTKSISPSAEQSGPDFAQLLQNSALQKSSVSFQAMLEVRNKLVNAYKEVMSMQV